MKIVNSRKIEEKHWASPKGTYEAYSKDISIELGRDPVSTDVMKRHPFDVAICRIPSGKILCPYHSHGAQWEYYQIISGKGIMRDKDGDHKIGSGDSVIFSPGEAHQIRNTGRDDLVYMVVADNPLSDSCYYPDSKKWLVSSPERQLIKSDPVDYFLDEE